MADGSEDSTASGPLIALNSTAAAPPPQITGPARMLGEEVAAACTYRAQAKAANTLRAYTSDWSQFEGWCDKRGLEPLPARPEAVATYLAALAMAGKADSTVGVLVTMMQKVPLSKLLKHSDKSHKKIATH